MKEIKALFFINSFVGGGAERVCLNLAKSLHEMNISSDFVTVYDIKADYDVPDYIRIFSLNVKGSASFVRTFLEVLKGISRVNRFILGDEYVLVTAHLQPSGFLASLSRIGKKCLYVIHGSQHLKDKHSSRIYKMALQLALKGKRTVTVSKGLKHELIYEYGIKPEKITVIYNPCIVSIRTDESRVPTLDKRPYILVMGRLEEEKNPLLALELYYKGKFYNKYDLIYLGKGSLEDRLKRNITDYRLENYVFVEGFQKDSRSWLMSASLLLSCSKQEGFGLNLAEALIYGIPVVAVDCPYGPKEILTGRLSEYLINPEQNFEGSISTISSALESYPEITSKYYKRFDAAIIIRKYLRVWKKYFGGK